MIRVSRNDRYAKRNELMLLVGYSFGLRVSELLNLRVESIDLQNGQIHLERLKDGKVHDPAISKVLQRVLKAYLKERNGKPSDFFSRDSGTLKNPSRADTSTNGSTYRSSRWLTRCQQHPHALRHGLGFAMSAAGHNPQSIGQALGHQSARMALQFYGSVTDAVADRARQETFQKYSWL